MYQITGTEMPEDLRDKIFDPLFTTRHIGTDLGLSSCKSIVVTHDGTTLVKNNPTALIITIPKGEVYDKCCSN